MQSIPIDYSVLDRFKFQYKPVGVKFTITKIDGIERLKKKKNICEMFVEAQTSDPFYIGKEDFCCVESMILGMEDPEPVFVSGLFGSRGGVYKEDRACRKMYQYLPKMLKGTVKYATFSSVEKLTYDPDVMVITASIPQAQVLLRSIGYSTGDYVTSRTTPVAACSWLYIHPILSGEMNWTVTGLGLGMAAIGILDPGWIIISVPWNLLPTMMDNLKELVQEDMDWQPTKPMGGDELRRFADDLRNNLIAELELKGDAHKKLNNSV